MEGFLPTPSARRATRKRRLGRIPGPISTHALREEGDGFGAEHNRVTVAFLPTPSARRATPSSSWLGVRSVLFLPTPSARRATRPSRWTRSSGSYFYPRPPRGGRRTHQTRRDHNHTISTHALREEGDTTSLTHRQLYCKISTHALREEGDCSMLSCSIGQDNFYPRPPRGGRPSAAGPGTISSNFYPRPPRGGRLPRLAGG